MQVGQLLVEQRWVAPEDLARALAEQRHTGKRICSLLIARGLLDADNAARALANQHNVPGVLQKHLEHRDQALARLLPAAIARACFALPIGRTRNQELIVCVRDPRAELRGILAQAVGGPVVIAVAPAHQLEQLIKLTYEGVSSQPRGEVSFDVDLSTRPIATVRDEAVIAEHAQQAEAPAPAPMQAPASDEVEVDLRTRHIPVIAEIGEMGEMTDLGSMTLVELDDVRVTKDPTQSGQQAAILPRTTTTPYPPLSRGTIAPQAALGRATMAPQSPLGRSTIAPQAPPRAGSSSANPPAARTTTSPYPPAAPSAAATGRTGATHALAMVMPTLDATIAALDRTSALDDATELAMRYLAGRFHHAVLFTINEGAALGFRGYGNQLTDEVIHAITVPLSAPSIVQTAHDTRRLATTAPADAGAIQDRLTRTLGSPQAFAAVPIEVDAHVAYVIAVGDAAGDQATAGYDLERLGRVLGAAYQRLPR